MKVRTGFVSNSSASSFIVQTKSCRIIKQKGDKEEDRILLATKEEIRKLKKYGFKETTLSNPFDYHCLSRQIWVPDVYSEICALVYNVICNQDEIIYYLVKNNIPFQAACQYGNEFVSYERDSDYILFARNDGCELAMYGRRCIEELDEMEMTGQAKESPVKKVSKKEYLNREKAYRGQELISRKKKKTKKRKVKK